MLFLSTPTKNVSYKKADDCMNIIFFFEINVCIMLFIYFCQAEIINLQLALNPVGTRPVFEFPETLGG